MEIGRNIKEILPLSQPQSLGGEKATGSRQDEIFREFLEGISCKSHPRSLGFVPKVPAQPFPRSLKKINFIISTNSKPRVTEPSFSRAKSAVNKVWGVKAGWGKNYNLYKGSSNIYISKYSTCGSFGWETSVRFCRGIKPKFGSSDLLNRGCHRKILFRCCGMKINNFKAWWPGRKIAKNKLK